MFTVHLLTLIGSAGAIWLFAGILLQSVDRLAHHIHRTGFRVAFFLLGFLTSMSEISVAVNSTISRTPEVSTGNLIGASFVLLLFIIPVIAVLGGGVNLRHSFSNQNLLLALIVIILPSLVVLDGNATRGEGALLILAYLALIFALEKKRDITMHPSPPPHRQLSEAWPDYAQIILAAIVIFMAGHFLVEESVYVAHVLSVPSSLIALLLLSLGTNVPELTIAIRSLLRKQKDVALGDYLGSAAVNTLIFGGLILIHGAFTVEPSEFSTTAVLSIIGLSFFYVSTWINGRLSRTEGLFLLCFYLAFLVLQISSIVAFMNH